MKKFEYKTEDMPAHSTDNSPHWLNLTKLLQEEGQHGWELVQIIVEGKTMIFKREI